MKRLSLLLLAAFCCLVVFGAPHGKCGKNLKWYYDKKSKTLSITGSGPMDDYQSDYNYTTGKSVYKTPWKKYHTQIESVIMAEGITHIGNEAFEDDEALRNCKIPGTVVTIGKSAFSGTGLTRVVLPPSVQKIGRYAFSRCYELTRMDIPASVTEIEPWFAFADRNITAFYVDPQNPRYCSVGGVLFDKPMTRLLMYPLGNPATSYTVPDGVEKIEEVSFYRAEKLKTLVLPESLKKIDSKAFEYCGNLESVNIPGSVSRIESETFGSCYKLRDLKLSEGLTYVGKGAFEYCKALTEVEVPTTVSEIHADAFKNSPNVKLRKAVKQTEAVAQASPKKTQQQTRQQTKSQGQAQKAATPAKANTVSKAATTTKAATTATATTAATKAEPEKKETKVYPRTTKYGGPITRHRGLAPWTGVVGSGVY